MTRSHTQLGRMLRRGLFAAVAIMVIAASTAVAGSGVGGVFNLGKINTVSPTSAVSGQKIFIDEFSDLL